MRPGRPRCAAAGAQAAAIEGWYVQADVGPHDEGGNRFPEERPSGPRGLAGELPGLPGRGARGSRSGGRSRRNVGRRGRQGEDLLGDFGRFCVFEAGAQKDMLPPEWEKEAEVRRVDRAGAVASREGRCSTRDGGRNHGPVGREGLLLFFASELHFRAAPGRGPRGAGLHDE